RRRCRSDRADLLWWALMRIILLAALDEEADAFMPGAGVLLDDPWPHARKIETERHSIHVAATQIGKVNIASAAARLHGQHGADLLMTIGTAGKLRKMEGDCFYLARSVQHDYGARRRDTFVHYPPGAWPMGPAHVAPYAAMADPGTGLPHATIASGDAFIED